MSLIDWIVVLYIAIFGGLIAIGIASDVRRWLRDRRTNRVEQARERMAEQVRFLSGDNTHE
jgi:hypothetical protein